MEGLVDHGRFVLFRRNDFIFVGSGADAVRPLVPRKDEQFLFVHGRRRFDRPVRSVDATLAITSKDILAVILDARVVAVYDGNLQVLGLAAETRCRFPFLPSVKGEQERLHSNWAPFPTSSRGTWRR